MLTAKYLHHAWSDWDRCKRIARGENDLDTDPAHKKRAIKLEHGAVAVGVVSPRRKLSE